MSKFMLFLGYIFLILILAGGGFVGGFMYKTYISTPSTSEFLQYQQDEQTKTQAINDIVNVAGKYQKLNEICESKYQSALSGNITDAFQYKGQADAIQVEIDTLLGKYETGSKTNATYQ